ncbi:hypothetical protein SD457_12745 [Coprobacillaceae bacterium CR2/5/TPMF4]|nr:hypothetical protein SD457_12745 [Coprobacillaceae bacterium CR2/5/TPMF4]
MLGMFIVWLRNYKIFFVIIVYSDYLGQIILHIINTRKGGIKITRTKIWAIIYKN